MVQKAHAEGSAGAVDVRRLVAGSGGDCTGEDLSLAARCDLLLPLVKGYSSEKAYELLAQSLQVLGGSGYTEDYPIEQYIRDAKIDSIYEGTTGHPGAGSLLPQDRPGPGESGPRIAHRDEGIRQGRA